MDTSPSAQQDTSSPANVQILDSNIQHTEGQIFTLHCVISGHVIDNGGTESGPIRLRIAVISDVYKGSDAPEGYTLYETTVHPTPGVLAPNQEGEFSVSFTLGPGASFHYTAEVEAQ